MCLDLNQMRNEGRLGGPELLQHLYARDAPITPKVPAQVIVVCLFRDVCLFGDVRDVKGAGGPSVAPIGPNRTAISSANSGMKNI
jgi:hypothetical protein